MDLREAAQQALEALEHVDGYNGWVDVSEEITALRAALAETTSQESRQVEPVAWITPGQDLHLVNYEGFQDWVPLYTAPPKREPLLIEGNEFIGDPPAPAKTWGEYFENVVTTSRLSGLRVSALANPVAHGIGGEE